MLFLSRKFFGTILAASLLVGLLAGSASAIGYWTFQDMAYTFEGTETGFAKANPPFTGDIDGVNTIGVNIAQDGGVYHTILTLYDSPFTITNGALIIHNVAGLQSSGVPKVGEVNFHLTNGTIDTDLVWETAGIYMNCLGGASPSFSLRENYFYTIDSVPLEPVTFDNYTGNYAALFLDNTTDNHFIEMLEGSHFFVDATNIQNITAVGAIPQSNISGIFADDEGELWIRPESVMNIEVIATTAIPAAPADPSTWAAGLNGNNGIFFGDSDGPVSGMIRVTNTTQEARAVQAMNYFQGYLSDILMVATGGPGVDAHTFYYADGQTTGNKTGSFLIFDGTEDITTTNNLGAPYNNANGETVLYGTMRFGPAADSLWFFGTTYINAPDSTEVAYDDPADPLQNRNYMGIHLGAGADFVVFDASGLSAAGSTYETTIVGNIDLGYRDFVFNSTPANETDTLWFIGQTSVSGTIELGNYGEDTLGFATTENYGSLDLGAYQYMLKDEDTLVLDLVEISYLTVNDEADLGAKGVRQLHLLGAYEYHSTELTNDGTKRVIGNPNLGENLLALTVGSDNPDDALHSNYIASTLVIDSGYEGNLISLQNLYVHTREQPTSTSCRWERLEPTSGLVIEVSGSANGNTAAIDIDWNELATARSRPKVQSGTVELNPSDLRVAYLNIIPKNSQIEKKPDGSFFDDDKYVVLIDGSLFSLARDLWSDQDLLRFNIESFFYDITYSFNDRRDNLIGHLQFNPNITDFTEAGVSNALAIEGVSNPDAAARMLMNLDDAKNGTLTAAFQQALRQSELTADEINVAVQQFTPAMTTAMYPAIANTMTLITGQVDSQLNSLSGVRGREFSSAAQRGQNYASTQQRFVGDYAANLFQHSMKPDYVWFRTFGYGGGQSGNSGLAGYDLNAYGFVAGVDKTLTKSLTVGGAYAYADTDVVSEQIVGEGRNSHHATYAAHTLLGYFRFDRSRWFLSGQFGAALGKIDGQRQMDSELTCVVDCVTQYTPGVDVYVGQAAFGVRLLQYKGFNLAPRLRYNYYEYSQESFREKYSGFQVSSFANTFHELDFLVDLNYDFGPQFCFNATLGYRTVIGGAAADVVVDGDGLVYSLAGLKQTRNVFLADIGGDLSISQRVSLTAVANIRAGDNGYSVFGGTGSVNFNF